MFSALLSSYLIAHTEYFIQKLKAGRLTTGKYCSVDFIWMVTLHRISCKLQPHDIISLFCRKVMGKITGLFRVFCKLIIPDTSSELYWGFLLSLFKTSTMVTPKNVKNEWFLDYHITLLVLFVHRKYDSISASIIFLSNNFNENDDPNC